VTGSISVVAVNGATFYVTGVKLEIGSVATPYNWQSLAKSLADCQRYFQKIGGATAYDILIQGYASIANQNVTGQISYQPMRATPTIALVGTFAISNLSSVNYYLGLQMTSVQLTAAAVGSIMSWGNDTTAKYLTLSAEL
jgi:hypothetical protein